VSKVQNEAGEKANFSAGRIVVRVTARLLAIVVAISFLAALLPLANVTSASSTMACCIGKKEEESHCHASAKAKKAAAHDHSTESTNPAFKSAVKSRCADCCACSVSARQHREKGKAQLVAKLVVPAVVVAKLDGRPILFSSNHTWAQISPRGPPSFLL
jgi:hypothetical protein